MAQTKKSPAATGLNRNTNIHAANYTQPINRVLDPLEGVRSNGPGRFLARCPAHDDRSPSLSIKEADDGTVLMKCWAGCTADEIVSAIGLRLSDLFPSQERHISPDSRSRLPAWKRRKLQEAAEYEQTIRRIALADLNAGRVLSDADIHRAELAQQRLQAIREALSRG